jgi:DNA-binding response OmpR family regulator
MPEQEKNILVIDDDPIILELICLHLQAEGFKPIPAAAAEQGLELLLASPEAYQAVISDVIMPGMDGYTLCERIREDQRFSCLPFIFVTVQTDIHEKIKGYLVGGDEYFVKPINPEEMIAKLRGLLNKKILHAELNKQLSESYNTAMQAMTYSSNLGQILLFIQNAMEVKSFAALSELLFEVLEFFALQGCVQYYSKKGVRGFRKEGDMTPLESNIMELSRNEGRFFDFGSRTIINYQDFSLLIKNMPLEDAQKYGIMKDLLGNLCNAIEAVTKILLSTELVAEKSKTMASVNTTLTSLGASLQAIQSENEHAIVSMIDDLEEAMLTLGLTEAQEEVIREIAMRCLNKSTEAFEQGKEVLGSFSDVHDVLSTG